MVLLFYPDVPAIAILITTIQITQDPELLQLCFREYILLRYHFYYINKRDVLSNNSDGDNNNVSPSRFQLFIRKKIITVFIRIALSTHHHKVFKRITSLIYLKVFTIITSWIYHI
jgi:hypothetical protein